MSIMNKSIEAFILHYSDVHDKEVSKMVSTEIIPTEEDAKRLLAFIDILFKYSTQDMDDEKVILGELASNYDAEKAGIAIFSILGDNNFDYLVDSWKS